MSSLDSDFLVMRSAPMPFWTGGRVRERSDVPDLLSEDVDEHVERFMTLPPKQPEERSSPSRKRNVNDEMSLCTGSPTSKRRTAYADSFGQHLQEDVVQWLFDNLGWDSSDVDSLIRDQEKMLQHWSEKSHLEPLPSSLCDIPPLALQRHCYSSSSELCPQQEALLQPFRQHDALEERQRRAFAKDAKAKSPSKQKARFDTHGHAELYPGKHVKIHGKDRAYASLRNGQATIFQCVGCDKRLLAATDTKLLYCSECGTLTPTEIRGEVKDSELFET